MRALIKQGLIDMNLSARVPANAAEHLSRYGQMLLEKNQVMNLTASYRFRSGGAAAHAGLCRTFAVL